MQFLLHRRSQIDMRQRHAEALALVSLWIPDTSLFPEALSLAAKLGHPVYDCL
ncbi:MAG: hypothetical protein LC637_10815 [Xanthomonadaceae bacterium]|nr:hypothetical protein [Xanthomonadaceae bacterium]